MNYTPRIQKSNPTDFTMTHVEWLLPAGQPFKPCVAFSG